MSDAIIIRHTGAAALVAAIRAAALEMPEVRPEHEFPGRYAAGRYPFTVPDELETGAELWIGAVSYTMVNGQRIGRDARERIECDGPVCKWPRVNVHPEAPGPFLPIPHPARAVFHYSTPDGARGSLTVANVRGALLALADKVHKARAAYDDKPRRAAKPSKTPAASAPHVAARGMWQEKDYAGALTLAQARGAVFFGASPTAGAFPYMDAQSVDAAGHAFTIARAILTGKFRVLHTAAACAVDIVRAGAPTDLGFATYTAALDWFETRTADEEFRAKLDAGARAAAPFDQSAALAHYMGADAAPDAQDEAPQHESAPADVLAPTTAPDAPTAAKSAPACIVARVVIESPALQATADNRHQSDAWRRVHWAQSKARELARGLRDAPGAPDAWQSIGFEFGARGELAHYRTQEVQAWRDATARGIRAARNPPTALSDTPTALSEPCAAVPPTPQSQATPDAAIPGESFARGFACGSGAGAAELTAREIEARFPGVDADAFANGMRDALAGDAWRAARIPCGEAIELDAETIEAAAPPTVQPACVTINAEPNEHAAQNHHRRATGFAERADVALQLRPVVEQGSVSGPVRSHDEQGANRAGDDGAREAHARRPGAGTHGQVAQPPTAQPAAPLIAIRDLLPGVLAHVHRAARTAPRAPLALHPMDPRRRIPGAFRPSYVLAARGGAL